MSRFSARGLSKCLLRFPATQPFVNQFSGNAQVSANVFREADCFGSHFAPSAREL